MDIKKREIGIGNIFAHNSVVAAETAMGNFNFFHAGDISDIISQLRIIASLAPGKDNRAVYRTEGAFIGAGAAVIRKSTIGKWSVVGANGVVTKDVRESTTVHGVPAREISSLPT